MSVTRAELIRQTKPLYEEAAQADPIHIEELTQAIFAADVFVWDLMTIAQLRALRRGIYSTLLQVRA